MPGPIAACFRCAAAAAAGAPSSGTGAAAGPSLATSVYETHLGLVALSWSRAPLGLSLRAVLRLSPPSTPGGSSSSAFGAGYLDDDADDEETTLAFRVRPWLLWRRRGSRRFRAGDRLVDLAWDLSRARSSSLDGSTSRCATQAPAAAAATRPGSPSRARSGRSPWISWPAAAAGTRALPAGRRRRIGRTLACRSPSTASACSTCGGCAGSSAAASGSTSAAAMASRSPGTSTTSSPSARSAPRRRLDAGAGPRGAHFLVRARQRRRGAGRRFGEGSLPGQGLIL